ncbi:MAG: F0F1 ATP synthase subunit delta [Jatrophihabitantaceae bacterium]
MHAASRQALATLRERLEAMIGQPADGLRERLEGLIGRGGGEELVRLARELAAVVELLAGQPRLRRVVADPSTEPARRAELIDRLLTGKIGDSALRVAREAASMRWSAAWDLIDALELLANDVLLIAAEQDNRLDQVEDELFRFERILDGSAELSALLDEAAMPAERRVRLLDTVVANKVHPITRELLEHAVSSRRRHAIDFAIDDLLDAAAKRRDRSIAKVTSAVELSAEQQNRLAEVLSEQYHRSISVRIAVDESVRGGLVVRIGDEVIDGSVAARLSQVRRALTG